MSGVRALRFAWRAERLRQMESRAALRAHAALASSRFDIASARAGSDMRRDRDSAIHVAYDLNVALTLRTTRIPRVFIAYWRPAQRRQAQ